MGQNVEKILNSEDGLDLHKSLQVAFQVILQQHDTIEKLKADILLAPHHGSRGSGSREFIQAVSPETIIISAGRNSGKMYHDPARISSWEEKGIKVLTTSDAGTITYLSDGETIEVKTY